MKDGISGERADGVKTMVPREQMAKAAQRARDFYEIVPGAGVMQQEFGWFCLDRWKAERHIGDATDLSALFGFEDSGVRGLGQLGWCEAAFSPVFDTVILEDRGEYELVQDFAGRHVLFFKGRRSGFMPEYVEHPVKDLMTWEANCKWRLDPTTPERYRDLEKRMEGYIAAAAQGFIIQQNLIGGYMYLRSLIGPADVLFKFYDEPELIHDCMKVWLELSDAVIAKHQEYVTIDELYLAEDICYNHGPLISPDMMREFLFPYYRQLIANIRARNIDHSRHLYIQIDTDGFANPTIDVYREIGMDYMSPFEVASGCDVVEVGRLYPDLAIRGGFDKRILASTKEAIDIEVDRIMPVMKARGGYIPTCDHGVPEEVSFENYSHYRKRMLEFA